ncbi:hypothetical protein MMC22_007801 [Lobaria immixta]|nr:hypothetical protein [Lobaria immixta]
MADPEVRISFGEESADVEMQGDGRDVEVGETAAANGENGNDDERAGAEEGKTATRATFVDFLKSPAIELVIGSGSDQTVLTAHQALLVRSPFFASAIAESPIRRIELVDEDLDAVSCFLEYLYTGEYFPPKTSSGTLEADSAAPSIDETGEQLLKHARVYTLAEKLGISALQSLSHSKIHLVTSTALAEIVYARYVYSHTASTDITIRKPVASFWGQRSHVLRHETEGSFRDMCLEFPQFAFDVLSFVLDVEEKRERRREEGEGGKSARKRVRAER